MHAKYKLFLIMPLFVMFGCKHACEYDTVVKKVSGNKIFVKDIKFNTYKVFIINARIYDHLKYIYPGDTLKYFDDGRICYEYKNTVNIPYCGHLLSNTDSLNARQDRTLYANTKYNKILEQSR